MTGAFRVVTVSASDREPEVAAALSRSSRTELILRCLDRVELLAALRGADLDAIVFAGVPEWLDLATASEARARQIHLIGLTADPLEADAFTRVGVEVADPGADIEDLLQRDAPAPVPHDAGTRSDGKLVAVWGPKGAPGRSTIAIEVAWALSTSGTGAAIVDGDLSGGDIAQMLAVVDEIPTVVWASQVAAEGASEVGTTVSHFRRAGNLGPVVVPGVSRPELWGLVSPFGWNRFLDLMLEAFDHVVVDIGAGIDGDDSVEEDRHSVAQRTLSKADHVLAVCRADPVGIKNFLWAAETLKSLVDIDDVLVIVNRVSGRDAAEIAYILKKHLGKRAFVSIPERGPDVRTAVARGLSVHEAVPASPLVTAAREIAAAVGGSVKARGLLARLGARA